MKKLIMLLAAFLVVSSIGLAQNQSPITGRIGGAPSDAGADNIKGRIGGAAATDAGASTISGKVGGGAATDAGASTISGRVGGGAATEAGGRTGVSIRDSNASGRVGLSGDPFTTRGSLGNITNTLGTTNRNVIR
jgi:hypothetical protein